MHSIEISRTGDPRGQVHRISASADYFPLADTVATSDQVEKKFLDWILRADRKPGETINGLELAREFTVSSSAIQEYLNRFGRFGLIEKRPNSCWIFRGFTTEFVLELFESARAFRTPLRESNCAAAVRGCCTEKC